jgi:hypothetical protein
MPTLSRRAFLQRSSAAFVVALLPSGSGATSATLKCHGGALGPHPAPRSGITGDKVLTRQQLAHMPKLVPLFDAIREIPEVVDGIRCNCGCSSMPGFYSLLSCYEGSSAMAMHCPVCQGQGRLAARLHKDGKSLDDIRVAVDAQFG